MNKLWSGGRLALLFIVVAVFLTGCVGVGGGVDAGWTTLTIDGSSLYAVRSTGEAVALDLADSGSLIWKYPLVAASASGPGCGIVQSKDSATDQSMALGAVYGEPAVSNGLMLFGSSEARLIALDAETGDPAWSFPVDSAVVGGVVAADGVAYLGTVSGNVYAVDLETQQSAWPAPFATGDRVWSTPVVNGSQLYVASMDHLLYAIDRATGESVWSVDVGGAIQGDIALYDDMLLAGGVDRRLYAIDATSGAQIWKTEQLSGWVWGAPLLSGDAVYFTTLDGQVHGHRRDNGQPLWTPIVLKGSISAGPVQAGESILVGTADGLVYLVDGASGSADVLYGLAQEQQRGGYSSTVAVQDDIAYLGSTMGFIVALDPATRTPELWVYPSPAAE
ncbi:MAG: outer membrane protein assembly factor BamB family protein, partial [Anaerolineae bacterium]